MPGILRRAANAALHPGYGSCGRCGVSWGSRRARYHTTWYQPGRGMFPLCEACWALLGPEGRLPYYRALWERWLAFGGETVQWAALEAAVLTEEARRAD